MDIRNISSLSQNIPQGLDSVTGGLVASVDAKGIGAVQTGIDAFSATGLDQAFSAGGEKPIATEPASFSSPSEYLQTIPESGSPQVLEQLNDPHFKPTEGLSSTFQNLFGDGALSDVANQLGMGQTPTLTTGGNDPGEVAGGPYAPQGGYGMPNDDGGSAAAGGPGMPNDEGGGAAAGPSSTDADQSKIYSDMQNNPLRSAIQLSDLTGAQTGAPSTPGSQSSDGVGDGIHPTDTGEGGGKMPSPEELAGRIDITDTGETAGEIQWGDSPDSMAIMGQRGSGEEQIDIPPPGTGQQPLESQFFQDLLSNNFSRFQNFGDTLHQLLTMQQDVLNRQ